LKAETDESAWGGFVSPWPQFICFESRVASVEQQIQIYFQGKEIVNDILSFSNILFILNFDPAPMTLGV